MEWISVDERLPESEKLVSIVVTNNKANVGYIHERGHWIIFALNSTYKQSAMHTITHWQSLPEPPKESN